MMKDYAIEYKKIEASEFARKLFHKMVLGTEIRHLLDGGFGPDVSATWVGVQMAMVSYPEDRQMG
jgi:hypothetical protein